MSCVATRVSLTIAILLSSSLLCDRSSNAVSLRLGDRSVTNPDQKFINERDFFSTVDSLEPNFLLQQDNEIIIDNTDSSRELSRLFVLDNKQLSSLYSTEKSTIFAPTTELFFDTISNNESQINSDRLEDVDWLGYFVEAASNIEIELTRNNESSDSEIDILSQTSFQNIYEEVYSSDIDLSASTTENNSGSANNATLDESSNIPNLVFFQYSPYISKVSNYDSSVSSSLSTADVLKKGKIGEDLSSRIDAVIVKPKNIFTNIPEIESQSRFNFKRNNSKVKRDPRMAEIESKMKEERERRQEEREKLKEKLEREQEQRRERRKREQDQIRRKRQETIRNQIRRQQDRMRKQQEQLRRQQSSR